MPTARIASKPTRRLMPASRLLVALWLAAVAATSLASAAMAVVGAEPMPGGWMLSNAWIRPCGRTPIGLTLAFLAHWLAMTAAMMLPSFAPMLQHCDAAMPGDDAALRDRALPRIALGWFAAWAMAGVGVLAIAVATTKLALGMPAFARAVPFAAAALVLVAGLLQASAWKSRHLAACRAACRHDRRVPPKHPARHGLWLGRHCIHACAGWMASLLAIDAMDLRLMALVTLAIAAERLARDGGRVRETGAAGLIGAGIALLARAAMAAA